MRSPLFPVLLLSTGALWSAPAFAQWETVHGHALETGERCPSQHQVSPQLRRSDNRPLNVPAGFKGEIEIYGHGVDLIRDVEVPGERWAKFARGVGGAENATRGCGSIGSLVVALDVAYTEAAATRTLRFGDQTMQIRIVKPSITGTIWSDQTFDGRSTLPSNSPPRPPATPVSTAGPPRSRNNGTGCGQGGGTGCSGGSSMRAVGGGGSATPFDSPPRLEDGIGSCLEELGGGAQLSPDDRTLTLTLPSARSEQWDIPCLTRPIFFNLKMNEPSDDVDGFRDSIQGQFRQNPGKAVDPPRYTGAPSGFTGPTALADPDRDYQSLRMTAAFARTFVGEQTITLRPPAGSAASTLTLVLRTDPANGIRDVEGVPFTGNRFSSDIEVRFDLLTGHAIDDAVWRVRGVAGSNPGACFASTSGTVSSFSSGIGKFKLRSTEAQGCANARFAVDIAPESGGHFNSQLLSRTVEFALPPLSAPSLQPDGSGLRSPNAPRPPIRN